MAVIVAPRVAPVRAPRPKPRPRARHFGLSGFFLDFGRPSHVETSLEALIEGTVALVLLERAVELRALTMRDLHPVAQLHRRDAEQFLFAFNAALDVGLEVVLRGDSARFQRAGKCARESTGER